MTAVTETRGVGAFPSAGGTLFRVWAPGRSSIDVVTSPGDAERIHPLAEEGDGYFSATVPGVGEGARYLLRLDGDQRVPDPASRSQPEGVNAPSEVVQLAGFPWRDAGWRGVPLEEMVIYELHVGTFTPDGTFDGIIPRLPYLRDLGVTALELLPVAEFSGRRNWGYDGVSLYAPSSAYGGAAGLRRLVDAAHAEGLAVLLDVVYNHLGPEGNYLPAVTSGKYFTDRHDTPWGDAVNYDGEHSEGVREFVLANAVYWATEYHLDGLRLDATHAILDDSPAHVLAVMGERVRGALAPDRHFVLFAEDERNERLVVTPVEEGGLGFDAVWADDFHHQLRSLIAGDNEGYFADYEGTTASLAETLARGWYYEGQHSGVHDAPRGTRAGDLEPPRFVHCMQNHDQVGNRAMGDRLHHQIPLDVYRAVSTLFLLTPYTPLLWMGQEWAASTPFQYFTDHPAELGRLVTEGRRREFQRFSAFRDPALRERIPDPQDPETFHRSVLNSGEVERMPHAGVAQLYREVLTLRANDPAARDRRREAFAVRAVGERGIALRRGGADGLLVAVALGEAELALSSLVARNAQVEVLLASEEARFGGEGAIPEVDGVTVRFRGPGAAVLRFRGG